MRSSFCGIAFKVAVLRTLTAADLPQLLDLSLSANWNQLEQDWRNLLSLAPAGCVGVEEDNRVVASATGVAYGNELAWIGMVLTLPEYRGRGHASKLMQYLLEHLQTPCIKLDATDLGRPMCMKNSALSKSTSSSVGWASCRAAPADRPTRPISNSTAWPLARTAAALLPLLGASRPGRVAHYLGPHCVRARAVEARARIRRLGRRRHCLLGHPACPIQQATALAAELGFTPVRRLWRMRRGTPIQERPDLVYALAGFEWG